MDRVRETFALGPFDAPRLWTGLWQLSSNAWGAAPVSKIRQAMGRHVASGYTAFADHYGSAELIFGQFRTSLDSPDAVLGATKWCVFKPIEVSREAVEAAVRQRMDRMRSQRVDLLQFHWQDYGNPDYLTALEILSQLRTEGLIAAIGLCNFDAARTAEICTHFPGIIVSNQVQFSLIDTRPLHGMTDVCGKHGVKLLTYGTLCGGFLSDKWIDEFEPDPYSGTLNPSQRKYLDMIVKVWGTWELFQDLLRTLRAVGDRHGGLSVSNIATRWVLDQPAVGAVIIGARLGCTEYPDDNVKVFGLKLTLEDRSAIDKVLGHSNSRHLIQTIGDCGAEYR
ncbi:NADP-dependent oxidoreductase domain-containing protein [Mycena belliarum]|uniref:NADP-dependent oxidoreductase domain-containing protein n=1 Tax=Mycena belliarum TaxID=1033014 RepID=A0AAD6TU74_9AGAR|nr:NADP-dependent oxidoreductase domain-containing protein [Mycena belliae]